MAPVYKNRLSVVGNSQLHFLIQLVKCFILLRTFSGNINDKKVLQECITFLRCSLCD